MPHKTTFAYILTLERAPPIVSGAGGVKFSESDLPTGFLPVGTLVCSEAAQTQGCQGYGAHLPPYRRRRLDLDCRCVVWQAAFGDGCCLIDTGRRNRAAQVAQVRSGEGVFWQGTQSRTTANATQTKNIRACGNSFAAADARAAPLVGGAPINLHYKAAHHQSRQYYERTIYNAEYSH
jgi:hypothetical protein